MRKISYFISLLLLGLSVTLQAQESSSPKKAKIWFGPRFGLDLSHFTYDINEITNQLTGNYQAGIMVQIGEKLYLQPEAYYASYNTSSITTNGTRTNFIKTPILAGWRIINLGLISAHIMAGPQFTFQLDNTDQFTGTNTVSWLAGAGVDVLGFITADLRYTIQPGVSISDQVQNFDPNSTGLNLTIGLKFR